MYVHRLAVGLVLGGMLVATSNRSIAQEAETPPPTTRVSEILIAPNDTALYLNALTLTNLSANQLGVEITIPEGALKAQLGIEGGLVVTKVPEGSEGAKAGLQAHDVILNINAPRSEPVRDVEKFNAILTENAGKKIEIGLLRGGKMQLVAVDVPQRQELSLQAIDVGNPRFSTFMVGDQYRLGVALSEADETLRTQLQLPVGEGLVVTEVLAGTAAEKAEIKQHDVLVELDEKHLANVEQINKQIQEIKARPVKLKLVRCGKSLTVEVKPEKVAAPAPTAVLPYIGARQFFTTRVPEATAGWEAQFIPSLNAAWIGSGSYDVDNDGGTVPDSIWMDIGLPIQTTPDGRRFRPLVAILCKDLDGRANDGATTDVNIADNNPRKQLEALKHQLTEMQKAVATLEQLLPAEQKQNPTTEQKQNPAAEQNQTPPAETEKK